MKQKRHEHSVAGILLKFTLPLKQSICVNTFFQPLKNINTANDISMKYLENFKTVLEDKQVSCLFLKSRFLTLTLTNYTKEGMKRF